MAVTSTIDTSGLKLAQILNNIDSDKTGLYAAKEWERLLKDFVPQDTKTLVRNTTLAPWQVTYNSNHALPVYYGGAYGNANFKTNLAKYASKEWDKAARNAGKAENLSTSLAAFIKKEIGG